MTPFYWWLVYWVVGYLLMVLAWWQDNDVTLSDVIAFVVGTSFLGPLMAMIYWVMRSHELRVYRQPIILLKKRGKRMAK